MNESLFDLVKADLRSTHDQDDQLLESLIKSAEQECLRFLGRDSLPCIDEPCSDSDHWYSSSSSDPYVGEITPDVLRGIILMVRSDYDETDPTRRALWRSAAETLWMPYRVGLGV